MAGTVLRPSWQASFGPVVERLDRFYGAVLDRWWVSYLLVAALQFKVIRGIWKYADLTAGDTSSYFRWATRWADGLHLNIVWSPLYTAFYGTVYAVLGDAYAATIAHRVIIVFLATLGVLAVARRLLNPALALLLAMWWSVLAINFNTLYEVHLFAFLPILAAWYVAARWDTSAGRGMALAILAASAVLVRNELSVAALIYGLICLYREYSWARAAGTPPGSLMRTGLRYAIPLLVVGIACGAVYARSQFLLESFTAEARYKHVQNMCQVYAFGYGQRHPEWQLSPWTECDGLAKATFGVDWPTLSEMVRSNPGAVLDHVLWNVELAPSGLQLALFDRISGTVTPDYTLVTTGSFLATILSIVAIAVVGVGAWRLASQWRYWWDNWLKARRGVWLAMFSVAIVALPVIATQRPRPSYLFALTFVLMAVIATAVQVLAKRWERKESGIALTIWLVLILLVPSYYSRHRSDRPLYQAYEAYEPYAAAFRDPRVKVVAGDHAYDLSLYLGLGAGSAPFDYGILGRRREGQTLSDFLDAEKIDLMLVEPRVYDEVAQIPGSAALLAHPAADGWTVTTLAGNPHWLALERKQRSS